MGEFPRGIALASMKQGEVTSAVSSTDTAAVPPARWIGPLAGSSILQVMGPTLGTRVLDSRKMADMLEDENFLGKRGRPLIAQEESRIPSTTFASTPSTH